MVGVCATVLCTAVGQPVNYCKAKIHECLCTERFFFAGDWKSGMPHLCRQHSAPSGVIDVTDDEPKKKKAKKERK